MRSKWLPRQAHFSNYVCIYPLLEDNICNIWILRVGIFKGEWQEVTLCHLFIHTYRTVYMLANKNFREIVLIPSPGSLWQILTGDSQHLCVEKLKILRQLTVGCRKEDIPIEITTVCSSILIFDIIVGPCVWIYCHGALSHWLVMHLIFFSRGYGVLGIIMYTSIPGYFLLFFVFSRQGFSV